MGKTWVLLIEKLSLVGEFVGVAAFERDVGWDGGVGDHSNYRLCMCLCIQC